MAAPTVDMTKVKISPMSIAWLFVAAVILIGVFVLAQRTVAWLDEKTSDATDGLVQFAPGGAQHSAAAGI